MSLNDSKVFKLFTVIYFNPEVCMGAFLDCYILHVIFFYFFSFSFLFFFFLFFLSFLSCPVHSLSLLHSPAHSLSLSLFHFGPKSNGFWAKEEFQSIFNVKRRIRGKITGRTSLESQVFEFQNLFWFKSDFWWFWVKRVEIGDLGIFGLVLGPRTWI